MDKKKISIQNIKLKPEDELRFEIESKNTEVSLEIKEGFAEIFGSELTIGQKYDFTHGAKIAVFTWHGCSIEISGKADIMYIAKSTPMNIYVNCHVVLDQLRETAKQKCSRGPVVMVVGPSNVGKSTICKLLLNYAVRRGRRPVYVDLDVENGDIGVPGTMGAMTVEKPANVTNGFSSRAPLLLHFGHRRPEDNRTLYERLVTQLAKILDERTTKAPTNTKSSGVVINTCGLHHSKDYKSIFFMAKAFAVDILLVVDQDRLAYELERDLSNLTKIVKLPKSRGVVERTPGQKVEFGNQKINGYFYGTKNSQLYPYSIVIKWKDINIFKIETTTYQESLLPKTMITTGSLTTTKLVPVKVNQKLLYHLLTLVPVNKSDGVSIESIALGFLCITDIDFDRRTITLLSPQPKPLPSSSLLLSSIQYMDSG